LQHIIFFKWKKRDNLPMKSLYFIQHVHFLDSREDNSKKEARSLLLVVVVSVAAAAAAAGSNFITALLLHLQTT
jgi:hypothetical protein